MKRIAFVVAAALLLASAGYWAIGQWNVAHPMAEVSDSPAMQLKKKYGKEERKKGIIGAKEWLYQIRVNQNTGIVSLVDVINARAQWVAAKQSKAGGGRSLGLTWEELGPDNVGGRTRAILIDPANPQKMWCGGVSGGLFFSTDGGLNWQLHPWTIENDNVGISTMRMAPNGDIYIGTGEGFAPVIDGVPNTFGAPGFIGSGVYRSTDGGETFSVVPATVPAANSGNDRWAFIYEIAFDPLDANRYYVATHRGLVMTTDGGSTFITPTGITPALQNNPCLEVATDPTTGTVYTVVGNRAFRSTDSGITFTEFTGLNGFPLPARVGRTEFATLKSESGLVYAVVSRPGFGGIMDGIYRSADNGENWSLVVQGSANGFNPLGAQAGWNIAFAIDPANPNRLMIGGQLELWSVNVNGGRDLIAYWQPSIPSNPYYIHADMHIVVYHPTDPNIMFVGSDGGVSKSTDAQQQFPKFTPRNKGLNITQFYGFSASFNSWIIGGTQDNGTVLNDCRNNSPISYREVNGGDGGDAVISRLNPQISFSTIYSGEVRRSVNGADSYSCALDENIDANNDCQPDQGTLFISPYTLWEYDTVLPTTVYRKRTTINRTTQALVSQTVTSEVIDVNVEKGILFLCTTNGLWFAPNALVPSSTPTWFNIPISGTASAVTISESGTAYVGTQNGNVFRVDGLPDGYILDSNLVSVAITPDTVNNTDIIDSTFEYFYKSPLDRDTWSFPGTGSSIASHQGIRRVNTPVPGIAGRYVTGFAINPNDEGQVAVTLGNYGNTNYVYQSLNANDPPIGQTTPLPVYEPIQGNLPAMPVYDAVFDYYNSNNLILGTELGVWSSNNALDGSAGISWSTENNNTFGAVPTFQVRMDPIYNKDCRILYAGTHGRGIFRSTSLTPNNCDVQPCKQIVSVQDVVKNNKPATLRIYPNPVMQDATLELYNNNAREAVVKVFDITGRLVYEQTLNSLVTGLNQVKLELSHLQVGTYIVAAQPTGQKVVTTKLIKQ